jgi:hypothetical protein
VVLQPDPTGSADDQLSYTTTGGTIPKPAKTADTTEIAARYFVYKLFDATAGQPMRWATLRGMNESRATIARAVERGWVILEGTSGKPLELKAALTDEGRRLARKAR